MIIFPHSKTTKCYGVTALRCYCPLNYQMKVSREVVKLVNFITATKRTDKKEFNGKRYVKIEAESNIE